MSPARTGSPTPGPRSAVADIAGAPVGAAGAAAGPGTHTTQGPPAARAGSVAGRQARGGAVGAAEAAGAVGAPDAAGVSEPPADPSVPAEGRARTALRGATPIALAGLVSNGANVLVTLAVARLLSTRGYGTLAQLIALFFVLSMPGSALLVGVVRRVTAWERSGQAARVAGWAQRTHRRALVLVVVFAAVAVALRWLIADTLNMPGPAGVAETLTAGGAWALLSLDRGLLQARHAYRPLARNLLLEGLTKCVLTIGLVAAGIGVEGAALAILAGVTVGEIDARRALRRIGGPVPTPEEDGGGAVPLAVKARERRSLAADVGTALAALALIALLQNVDVIVLGREHPGNSGAYAAISVATKSLVLAAVVLAGFLLPEAAARRQLGQHALHQLGVTLSILAIPEVILLAAAFGAPEQVLRLAFGDRLTAAAHAFGPLTLAMVCLAATVLFTHYLLAVGRARIVALLAVAAGVSLVLLAHAHGAPVATARNDLYVQASVAALAGAAVLHAARRQTTSTRSAQTGIG